ncbi:MAG: twitch domain-containing radical SAM protein, partial [Bacteroidota bacterium]
MIEKENSKLCLMPWIHFHMDTGGKVKACCSTSITYGQLSGNTDAAVIDKIWNGKSVKTFRKKLLQGHPDKRCAVCYLKEKAGKSSMRTETLKKYPTLIKTVHDSTDSEGKTTLRPFYLDLRFSNICNLRCRTCWHGASSSWFEEAKLLSNTAGEKALIKATSNNPKVLKNILAYSTEPAEIYFAGGEPLLMDEHYQILTELIKTGKTDTYLRYNSNLSILKFKEFDLCDLWRKFKHIRLSVSVDATEALGNYIRKGMSWDKLLANMRTFFLKQPHIR